MDPNLKAKILNEFGLTGLPPKEQDETVTKIGGAVFKGVLVRALGQMDAKAQKRFEEALKEAGDSPEALLAALRDSVPNFSELVQTEVSLLAEESRRILSPDDVQA
jgi:hypothetical protein